MIYEYRCKSCNHKFDKIVFRVGKFRKPKCPKCNGKTDKLISCPGLLMTDTSFPYTGTVHKKLGKRPIEGRVDWKRRIEKEGLMELSREDVKKM